MPAYLPRKDPYLFEIPAISRLRDSRAPSNSDDAGRWQRLRHLLQGSNRDLLPFSPGDVTAGSEHELQAVVLGSRQHVDLPQIIEESNFYGNLRKRSAAQDSPKRALRALERFLSGTPGQVWENSWVRFPQRCLGPAAHAVLMHDLKADKADPDSPARSDIDRFFCAAGEPLVRVPVSYLMKLALADALSPPPGRLEASLAEPSPTSQRLLDHYLNDNSSPETVSFYVVSMAHGGPRAIAQEFAQRFLLTQLLCKYASAKFELRARGQQPVVYSSPHPPLRQQQLNECISDAFYRELYASPCLSGWDQGEAKHRYMRLCHEVLSRSRLHAVAKVRDAGLMATNLVVLPTLSSTSLANNGVHVSLGSRRLAQLMSDPASGFGPAEEKLCGDLVIKLTEHFLPLFVGTYSAAPWRVGFADFHAERVLGFLPHELDFTHLRMIWRRWKNKASIKLLGQPLIPTGYQLLDNVMSWVFRLKGDFVADSRLIDYLSALMSTDESPALDGRLGSWERLKRDLADQGVYDTAMAPYSLYRLRQHEAAGFSGFEGRFYSLFESFGQDLTPAVELQQLITLFAFAQIASGRCTHADIPDDPSIESERRQIFFGTAIGIPTFFVRKETPNRFLRGILADVPGIRHSHRYPGYVRVYNTEFRLALIRYLQREGAACVEMLGCQEMLTDLHVRIAGKKNSAAARLTGGILETLAARRPISVPASEFNHAAETFYREGLRHKQTTESLTLVREAWLTAKQAGCTTRYEPDFCTLQQVALEDKATLPQIQQAIWHLVGLIEASGRLHSSGDPTPTSSGGNTADARHAAPIH